MASQNNNSFLKFSQSFLSFLVVGLFLSILFLMTGTSPSLGIFLGVIGGLGVNLIASAGKNSPKPQSVPANDGIDAGLKYWLVFLLGFSLLGYQAPISILLSGIGGVSAGWVIAWWKSKEETKTQLSDEVSPETETQIFSNRGRQYTRKPKRRFRRASGSFNFKFWQK